MDNKMFEIFDKIHAEDELKRKTSDYLRAKIAGRRRRKIRYAVALASLVLFFTCAGFSWKIYFTPVAYIDIDVNPSIGLALNGFGKVIRSNAYNDDGTRLLSEVNLKYADYSKAFEKLLVAMNGEGYFAGQDSLLCVTVQTNEKSREDSIQDSLQRVIALISRSQHCNISTEIFSVTEEIKHCADENRISPAKYLAIQDLMRVDSETDFEECREQSVHELRRQVEEHCRSHEEERRTQEDRTSESQTQESGTSESQEPESQMQESGASESQAQESQTQESGASENQTQGNGTHSHGHGAGGHHH